MLKLDITKSIGNEFVKASFVHDFGVLAIMGASGSGKTTLLNTIVGIHSPDSGFISLDENIIFSKEKNISMRIQDRNVGYVFQDLLLFPNMTLYENIRFPQESKDNIDESFIDDLLLLMKIEHLKDKYPNEVSGGEKQRCALARAISSKPRLILIDEGFSALDSKTKIDIMTNMKKLIHNIGALAVIVTHNPDDADFLADNYFVFKQYEDET
ncbi:MAG: ATP-binding cassette domain-containing protein [Acidaminobacteraceae bacterium]